MEEESNVNGFCFYTDRVFDIVGKDLNNIKIFDSKNEIFNLNGEEPTNISSIQSDANSITIYAEKPFKSKNFLLNGQTFDFSNTDKIDSLTFLYSEQEIKKFLHNVKIAYQEIVLQGEGTIEINNKRVDLSGIKELDNDGIRSNIENFYDQGKYKEGKLLAKFFSCRHSNNKKYCCFYFFDSLEKISNCCSCCNCQK